jgi:hypothetical protein
VARLQKTDKALDGRMEEVERGLFLLKVAYDKYFSGLEPIEPMKERDDMRRVFRDLSQVNPTNATQLHKLRTLRARWSNLDLYLTRNLVQIERGTHAKFRFRADAAERARLAAQGAAASEAEAAAKAAALQGQAQAERARREDAAYRDVYERYMEARRSCGQTGDLDFESVKKQLAQQVRVLKSQYKCTSVKFRVTVEDGKARLKAAPQRDTPDPAAP